MNELSLHFSRSEFACRCGCGHDTVDAVLVQVLEDVRDHFGGRPITINSGCRCDEWNRRQGGSRNSQHLDGRAADIVVHGIPPHQVADYLDDRFPDALGIGTYVTFTHVDTRTNGPARWSG